MKAKLFFFALMVYSFSHAQIELEHTYDSNIVARVNLEYSGEKYYFFNSATNELVLHNADHSPWKTIILPAPPQNEFTRVTVFHVSEAKINADENLEIIYGYFNSDSGHFEAAVLSESGAVLVTITDVTTVDLSEIPGLSPKLIASYIGVNRSSKVYGLPALNLEHTYTEDTVTRTDLEISGEKYYLLDKINNTAEVYNSNHTLWKTISLPKPETATYRNTVLLAESDINGDPLLKVGYSYYSSNPTGTYSYGKIVKENNSEILSIPDCALMQLDKTEGLEKKLIAVLYYNNEISHSTSSMVYQPTSLNLEHTYGGSVSRIVLENSGEKYATVSWGVVKVYNPDHTLWKSIALDSLPASFDSEPEVNLHFISETKIANDDLLEVGYSFSQYSPLMYYEWYGDIINENGHSYLSDAFKTNANAFRISEFSGLPTKLIGICVLPQDFSSNPSYYTNIFTIDNTMGNSSFQRPSMTVVPNPANSFLNIASKEPIVSAKFYTVLGEAIGNVKGQNLSRVSTENLPSGIYLLNLTTASGQTLSCKVVVSH